MNNKNTMLNVELINKLKKAVEEANSWANDDGEYPTARVRSYSGKFMYERSCLSVYMCNRDFASTIALFMGFQYQQLGSAKFDDMGKGTVIYWPNIEYYGLEEDRE